MGEGHLKKAVAVSLTPTRVHRLWDSVMATFYLVFCCQMCSQPLHCEHAQEEDLHRQCCLGKRMLFMGTERAFSSILVTCRPSPTFHQAHGAWGPVQPVSHHSCSRVDVLWKTSPFFSLCALSSSCSTPIPRSHLFQLFCAIPRLETVL